MRGSRRLSLTILALALSCGPAPEDTRVGDVTRSNDAPPQGTRRTELDPSSPPLAAYGALTFAGFAAQTRFAVFTNASSAPRAEDHSIVVDLSSQRAFDVDGAPIIRETEAADDWQEAGFSPANLPTSLVATDGGILLVRTLTSVEAIDLTRRGALVGAIAVAGAELVGASISNDASVLAAWTADTIRLARPADDAAATYPIDATTRGVTWGRDSVLWTTPRSVKVVRLERLDDALEISTNAAPEVLLAKDGTSLVVFTSAHGDEPTPAPGLVEVYRGFDSKPRARFTSTAVSQTIVSDDGSKVAWTEPVSSETQPLTTFIHTIDVDTGIHARFRAEGECSIATQELVRFEGTDLIANAECSPGCPSIPEEPAYVRYDMASGRVLGRWLGPVRPPYVTTMETNHALASTLLKARRPSTETDLERGQAFPLVHHPMEARTLWVDPNRGQGVELLDDASAASLLKLEDSTGLGAADLHFSNDGAYVAGASADGYLAIWSSSTGARLWSRR